MTPSRSLAGDAAHPPKWRWRFTVPVVVALVGTAGVLYFVFGYAPRVRQQTLEHIERELALRVDDLREVIETTLAEDRADLDTVAAFPSAIALVSNGPADQEGIGGPRHLERIFESFAARQAFDQITILGADGSVRVATGTGPVPASCREPGFDAIQTATSVVKPHVDDGQQRVAVAVPIVDERGRTRGAVVGEYRADRRLCRGLLATVRKPDGMTATLAAQAGSRRLYICDPHAPDDAPHEPAVDVFEVVAQGSPGVAGNPGAALRHRDLHGRVVYATGATLRSERWDVVAKVPAESVDAAIRDDLARTAAMWAASFLAAAAMVLASWRERERAHQFARARERARLSLLIDHAADPILVLDEEGRVREFNRRALEFYGLDPREMVGGVVGGPHRPERRARPRRGEAGGAADADAVLYETTHVAAGGREVPVQVSSRRVELDGETLYVAVIRDISEQRRLQAQFLQAQKMEGIGRLAGGVAHDFNNLLTAIMGYAELLSSEIEDPTLRSYTEEITKAGSRASALTTQLLAFARRQVVEPRVIDVNALVHDAQKMLQRLVGEDVTIETVLESDAGSVRADAGQLQQVLVNLVVNARDAMPDGGTVTIETRRVLDVPKGSDPERTTAIEFVEMAVTDTGEGMTAEVRSHLFEPFFTTKPQGKGTGLGLATCHGIVTQSGGHIDVQSEVGRGTSVRVRLPRVAADVESGRDERTEPLRGGDETILVVEDEAAVRRLAALSLVTHGYRVLEAADGRDALELAAKEATIDLLLTDVVMPGIDGRELASRLQLTRPGLRVLFMSGHTEDAILHRGVLDAGLDFIHKPFAPEDLARRVREVLDRHAAGPTSAGA